MTDVAAAPAGIKSAASPMISDFGNARLPANPVRALGDRDLASLTLIINSIRRIDECDPRWFDQGRIAHVITSAFRGPGQAAGTALTEGRDIFFQSENGILGVGAREHAPFKQRRHTPPGRILHVSPDRRRCGQTHPYGPRRHRWPRFTMAGIGVMRRGAAAWIARYCALGFTGLTLAVPIGLMARRAGGPKPRLTAVQKEELSRLAEAGPLPDRDGVTRWRRADLKGVIRDRPGVDDHERTVGGILKESAFSHLSARPRHHGQDPAEDRGF